MKKAEEQLEILAQNCTIRPIKELSDKISHSILNGTSLTVKYGIDPTGDLHLGHYVALRKLSEFAKLGHTPFVIFGCSTAALGDPTGRDSARTGISEHKAEQYAITYIDIINKIVGPFKYAFNNSWFSNMSFGDCLNLSKMMTVSQITSRRDFSARIDSKQPVYLSECIYPIMQGFDSYKINADVEIGGEDQTFNINVGRDVMSQYGVSPQVSVTVPILPGTDGVKKMSKSASNTINISDKPYSIYTKIMSISDACMDIYYKLLTDLSPVSDPYIAKKELALEIVSVLHGKEDANHCKIEWENFVNGEISENITSISLTEGTPITDFLVKIGFCSTKSEARRLISQSGVKIDGRVVSENHKLAFSDDQSIMKCGKKRIVKLIFEGTNV